jgi:hypothetical protein
MPIRGLGGNVRRVLVPIGAAVTQSVRDVATRLKLTVRNIRDVATRFRLTALPQAPTLASHATTSGQSADPTQWTGIYAAEAPFLGVQSPTLIDVSGNGRVATLVGLDAGDWSTGARAGYAVNGVLTLDGTTSYLDWTSTTLFDFANADFTVAQWFKAPTTAAVQYLMNKRSMTPNAPGGWFLRLNATTGTVEIRLTDSGGLATIGQISAGTYGDNAWHLVVATFHTDTTTAANNTAALYVDGVLDQTTPTTGGGAYVLSTFSAKLGTIADFSAATWLAGPVDDIRVYNRILTAPEILDLYTDPYGFYAITATPMAFRDVPTRLKLNVRAFRDVATRVKVGILAYRDVSTRLKLSIRAYRDAATRFKLSTAAVYRDVRTRLVLQGGPGQLLITFTAPTLDENGQPLPGDLDGFLVYYGTAPGVYGPPIDIGHVTTYLLTELIHGTVYYVSIRSYDTFGNLSAFSTEVSKAADPIGTLYPHLGDVATRFRLSVSTPRDVFTRFRLAVRQWRDVATRLKLTRLGLRDVATRLKLAGRGFRDVASRVVLNVRAYRDTATRLKLTVQQYRDVASRVNLRLRGFRDVSTRLKLGILAYRDTATRLKLTGRGYRDVSTRVTIAAQNAGIRDVVTRLKLSVRAYRDVTSRVKLSVMAYRDTATRLKLGIQASRDAATRLTLGIRQYRDVSTRVKLGIQAYRDVATRLKLSARQYRDVATRFRLAVANAGYRDVSTRVRLRVTAYKDVATRLNLGIRAYRDIATRVKLTVQGLRDVATRVNLTGRAYRDVGTRLKLHVRNYRDVATRLKLLRRGYRDVALRFKLQLLQTPATRDVQLRFVLALPQLAPSLVFASVSQPAALASTLDLLTWAAVSTPAGLVSDERVFIFIAGEAPAALESTLDVLTWAASSSPAALVSEARGGG